MAFKDYLGLVLNGIKNGDKIIEAMVVSSQIKNGTAMAEEIAEIMKRKEICANCPFNSKNAAAHGLQKFDLPFDHCIHCKCRIGGDDTKEYCLTCNCGITEWNKRNPDKQLPLKWKAFKNEENINPDSNTV
jgi:hypothetical protein